MTKTLTMPLPTSAEKPTNDIDLFIVGAKWTTSGTIEIEFTDTAADSPMAKAISEVESGTNKITPWNWS